MLVKLYLLTRGLVAPCSWEFNRGREGSRLPQPLSHFASCMFSRGFRHYSTTIALLSLLCCGRVILPARVCDIERDRVWQSHSLSLKAFFSSQEGEAGDSIAFNRFRGPLREKGASFLVSRCPFCGIEVASVSFLVSRFLLLVSRILHSLVQHLDHLLPGINLSGPRHPAIWRSKAISIPKRRSKNLDTPKKTSRC